MPRVFVYGTLKQGEGNHLLLEGANFIGEATTRELYTLLDLGAFPGVTRTPRTKIRGEVYEVDGDIMQRLDRLEGYPGFYDREIIETDAGQAWMYVLEERYEQRQPIIDSGVWIGRKG